jgi:zinc D-Ala-D-Ala carboxypeptidase
MDSMTQLTPHFTLEEMLKSQTARNLGFTEQYNPSDYVKKNLLYLAENVLEKIRQKFGPVTVTSGYRCGKLNNRKGGGKNSFHLIGAAADIDFIDREKNREVFNFIRKELPFTELINEFDYDWIHVAIVKGRDQEKVVKKVTDKGTEIIS